MDYNLINYSEKDKFATKSYSYIHDVFTDKNLGDVKDIDIDNLPTDIDIITHGSPCTSFSIGGYQKGGNEGSGTKSSLMWYTVKIIKEVKPKYIIWENVKNVLSSNHIHNFEKYKNTLKELGYNNKAKVIDSNHWGVPQSRERIFVVSLREDVDNNFEFPVSNLERQGSLFDKDVIDIESKVLKDYLEDDFKDKFYLSEEYRQRFIRSLNDEELQDKIPNKIIGTTQNKSAKGTNMRHWVYDINQPIDTLTATGYKQPKQIVVDDNWREHKNIRKLTPLEYFRLMGFDDEDFYKCKENGISNTQLYKQAGNSIVVDVLEYIFRNLFKS